MPALPASSAPESATAPAVAEFGALVERHRVGTWRYLRVLGAGPDVADDLLQETFVVAWRRRLRDDGPAAVAAFLRATARHLWLRSRRRRVPLREVEAADAVWNERCAHDDGCGWFAALADCVAELPERSRRLVHGTYGEERSRREMAVELGLSEDGVKSALARLRAALRACVQRRQS